MILDQDVKADSSTASGSTEATTDTTEQTGDTGEATEAPELGEKAQQRFQRLANENRELRSQVSALDERIRALDAKREEGQPKSPEQKELEGLRQRARKDLAEIVPELDEIERLKTRVEWFDQTRRALCAEEAGEETERLMKEHGVPVTEDTMTSLAGILKGIIESDPKLLTRYYHRPEKAVQVAFTRWMELSKGTDRRERADVQREGEKAKTLPRGHREGGGSGDGKKPPQEAQSVADADKRIRARLEKVSL